MIQLTFLPDLHADMKTQTRLAWCPMSGEAHADWDTGDAWRCRRCGIVIPAAHVWFPNESDPVLMQWKVSMGAP